MDLHRSFVLARAALFAVVLCGEMAIAKAEDRILNFDTKITVARDRTLRVNERFEITNDGGFFDSGFHRQLIVKPAGPQRAKAVSFQDLRATVDGSDAVITGTEGNQVLNLAISTESRSWSRGGHAIELNYTVKHQFLVYDSFEDWNQNISGEWPVPIENASVELNFPEGLPAGASITADTGSGPSFRFDCVRTDLPRGVRFETSHAIPAGGRLFLSARFVPRGYFVSSVGEDGIRAVMENHPWLYPCVAFAVGMIVFTAAGFVLGLLVFKVVGPASAAASDHRSAAAVALIATVLSGASMMVLHEPYTAMPGFMLGALASIVISGNPHGGEPFSLVTVTVLSNFAFYYLVALGLHLLWSRRRRRPIGAALPGRQ